MSVEQPSGPPVVYLDHASTTPLAPAALEAMLPFLTHRFANPSGLHAGARRARRALDDARDVLAAVLGFEPGEIVFTSGGTEADNLAVTGAHLAAPGAALLVSAVEHKAVLAPAQLAGGRLVPVDRAGQVTPAALGATIEEARGTVALVSVMLANNETGVVQPLPELVAVVRELAPRALVHTDAVHAFAWLDVATLTAGCDLVSVSAHKFGGPKGTGALAVRSRARPLLHPLVPGGGQEGELRPGTQNVAGVAGMAAAAAEAARERGTNVERVGRLRDRLADGLLAACPGAAEAAPRALRVAGNCHLLVDGLDGEELAYLLDDLGVASATGSSCASGAHEPSHVLQAMGLEARRALGALRLTLGATTTATEVARALEAVPAAAAKLAG